jgi:hypothetical protein
MKHQQHQPHHQDQHQHQHQHQQTHGTRQQRSSRKRRGRILLSVGNCLLLVSTLWNFYSVRICLDDQNQKDKAHIGQNDDTRQYTNPLLLPASFTSEYHQQSIRQQQRRNTAAAASTATATVSTSAAGKGTTRTPCQTLCECFQHNVVSYYYGNSNSNSNSTTTLDTSNAPKLFPLLPSIWWGHVHPILNHFEQWDIFGGNSTTTGAATDHEQQKLYR